MRHNVEEGFFSHKYLLSSVDVLRAMCRRIDGNITGQKYSERHT